MKCTGKLKDIALDYFTKKSMITLYVNEDIRQEYDKLIKKDKLSIDIKQYRAKRSNVANAYMWELLQKMADVLSTPGHRIDKWEIYLDMLTDYGVFTHIVVKPEAVERMKQEWRAIRELGEITVGNTTGIQLQCYYGSHTYNTKEMARLIDGVVTRCRELDIETLSPTEIQRMKEQWGVNIG